MNKNKEFRSVTTSEGVDVPLWVEPAQWQQATAAVVAARVSLRLQEAQEAMLGVELFLIDCPEVTCIKGLWRKDNWNEVLVFTLLTGEGKTIDSKTHGAQTAYARGEAKRLEQVWPINTSHQDFNVHRADPFRELGPILLGVEFYGAWAAEREGRELGKGLGMICKSSPRQVKAL